MGNNDENIGELAKAMKILDQNGSKLKVEAILHQDAKELRLSFGKEHLLVKIQSFLELADDVAKVEAAHSRIWRMHQARKD